MHALQGPTSPGCPSLVMLPYTEGVSEDIRRVCRKFGLKVVFRSVPPLHANQGEGHPGDGEEVQGGIPNPL